MALPFFNNGAGRKKRDQMLSIDLGGRITKAIQVQRKGGEFVLSGYALMDAPIFEKSPSAELLTEHLKQVCEGFGNRVRLVSLAVGVNESLVRHAEMPPMPADDMRLVLKNNSRVYLQQDLAGHVFDAYIIPSRQTAGSGEKPVSGSGLKNKVIIAGAKAEFIDNLHTAVKNNGLMADYIVPALLSPVNAFEYAMPEAYAEGAIALVDVGFRNTTICLLAEGELVLTRVVSIGGDKLTNGLAEALNISYAEAEGIKIGMAAEVHTNLEPLIIPLGRELRASIDFFEHQNDRTISQVYVSGGSSRSEFIVQTLQSELIAECKVWNPTSFMKLDLPPQQAEEINHVAPQLTVAVGTAMTAF